MFESALQETSEAAERRFHELLKEVRPRALWLLGRHRIPAQDAEDLLQQTLLALLLKYQEVRDPEAWVLGTLRIKCIRYWRLRRARPLDPLDEAVLERAEPPGPLAHEVAEARHDLELALARLPVRCRFILRHRYGFGYRATEIAEILDCPAASVRKSASRCLSALARELRAAEPGRPEGGRRAVERVP